jgi:hypothetical protein
MPLGDRSQGHRAAAAGTLCGDDRGVLARRHQLASQQSVKRTAGRPELPHPGRQAQSPRVPVGTQLQGDDLPCRREAQPGIQRRLPRPITHSERRGASLNRGVFIPLRTRPGGPLRPRRRAPGSGSGRWSPARLPTFAQPSRTGAAQVFSQTSTAAALPGAGVVRGSPPAPATHRSHCHRHRATRSPRPNHLRLREYHQVKHPDGVAVDEGLQL